MKKLYIILIIFLIVLLLLGCAGGKNYKVTVYREKEEFKYLSEKAQKVLEDSYKYKIYKSCYAKEIISYTDTSVRFIDSEGREQFLSGDKIEVRKMD